MAISPVESKGNDMQEIDRETNKVVDAIVEAVRALDIEGIRKVRTELDRAEAKTRSLKQARTAEPVVARLVAGLIEKRGLLVWAAACPAEDIDWNTIVDQEREARDESFDFLPDSNVRY